MCGLTVALNPTAPANHINAPGAEIATSIVTLAFPATNKITPIIRLDPLMRFPQACSPQSGTLHPQPQTKPQDGHRPLATGTSVSVAPRQDEDRNTTDAKRTTCRCFGDAQNPVFPNHEWGT